MNVFITGMASGLGEKIAKILVQNGHCIYGCDNNEEKIILFKEKYPDLQNNIVNCDVSNFPKLKATFEKACLVTGGIDGLANNAGMYLGQSFDQYDDVTLDKVIDINLKAPMKLSLWFAEHIQSLGVTGSIVNVASVAGEVGSSDAPYGSVKAGVIGLTKSNAMNFAPNIRVNCVSPGLIVDTEIADAIPDYRYAEYKRQELLSGDLTTDSVAKTVCFLLSENACSMTGAILRSDNGCYPR